MREARVRARTLLLIGLAHDTFWLEISVAIAAIAWAIAVWWMTGDLIDRPAYTAAARFAPDQLWEAMACCGGLVQVMAAFSMHRVIRWLMGLSMGGFWIVLADGLHLASPMFTPSLVPYGALAAMNLLAMLLPLLRRIPWLQTSE